MLQGAGFRQISLYFSLLAGNLGQRLVRHGLRRQPASPVSRRFRCNTAKSAPSAGFLRQAESLCVPNSIIPRPNMPKISAYHRYCSRFLENRRGDLVRLHCATGHGFKIAFEPMRPAHFLTAGPISSALFSAASPGLTRAFTRYLPSRRSSPMKNAIGTLGRCVSELDISRRRLTVLSKMPPAGNKQEILALFSRMPAFSIAD